MTFDELWESLKNESDEAREFFEKAEKASLLLEALSDLGIDVEEVVHCEDCRYYWEQACHHASNRVIVKSVLISENIIYAADLKVEPDHFCGYAERRVSDV